MANKIVSINLDETTDKIRKKVPNFSLFVRQCLHRYSAQLNAQQESCQYNDSLELFDGKCNPLNAQRPICFHCWPNGAPTKELVREYRLNREMKNFVDQQPMTTDRSRLYISKFGTQTHDSEKNMTWFQEQCFNHNSMLIQIDKTLSNDEKRAHFSPEKTPKLSKIRRIWDIIFSTS